MPHRPPINRRLPAEWEPQSTVLLAWPNPNTDWAGNLTAAEQTYCNMASQICRFQPLTVLCSDDALAQRAQALLAEHTPERTPFPIDLIPGVPYNDTWIRDYGPLTVEVFDNTPPYNSRSSHELVDFTFNGWGAKFAAERDNAVTGHLFQRGIWQEKVFNQAVTQNPQSLILEGGSIESDGQGTLLTTRHCLTAPNRNQPMSYEQISDTLLSVLGAKQLLSLEHGQLMGDDTDGHIDTLVRFCDPDTLVYQGCDREEDEHFLPLNSMAEALTELRNLQGKLYRCHALPLPEPKFNAEGERLPASYANFLIINHAVLVPTYKDPHDEAALAVIQRCFPDREVIGIDCLALIEQGGSLHCCTMQIPAPQR